VKEKEIQSQILEYLSLKGFPLRLDSSLSGRIVRRNLPSYPNGTSDIFFMSKGFAYFFEIKTPSEHDYIKKNYDRIKEGNFSVNINKNNHIKDQISFLEKMSGEGAITGFVSSINDVDKLLR
jgi:hypothetical protein